MGNKPIIYALSGNIGSGKSTLAKYLKKHFNDIPHLDGDDIRTELYGHPGAHPSPDVWPTMRNRTLGYLAGNQSVIFSATGMAKPYRAFIQELENRKIPMHKIQLHCDPEVWKQREGVRSDRWNLDQSGNKVPFEMPERAYDDSAKVQAEMNPHLRIDTSNMKPDEVFQHALNHIQNNPAPKGK